MGSVISLLCGCAKKEEPLTMLKANGKNIYDQNGEGELVQLKGVNIGGWLFQELWMTPTEATSKIADETTIYSFLEQKYGVEGREEVLKVYQDAYFSETDFDYLKEVGVNCLRLPFWFRNLVDNDGNVKADWYERMDWFIEQAGKRGMYVILDFHGAPGSQNGSDHSGKDGGGMKMVSSEFFFGDNAQDNQELYYKLWEMIAERYKEEPIVAGYDLLNEPYCTYRYDTPFSDELLHGVLWNVYDKAYERIRAVDPNHIIIMEATWDPVDLPNPEEPGWENVMYEYHNYLYDDYNNDRGQQISNMENKLRLIQEANYNVPSYMGEFNYFNNMEAWEEGLALLNEAGIHWTIWTYKTIDSYENWGLYNQSIGSIRLEDADLEKTKAFYGRLGESKPNEKLIECVKKAVKADSKKAE